MILDLNIDVNLRICDTVREENGLAMSSRNMYLSKDEKDKASVFNFVLNEAKKMILEDKIEDMNVVKQSVKNIIETKTPESSLQYIAITDNNLLEDIKDIKNYNGEVLISLAAYMGKTRLIDNILYKK